MARPFLLPKSEELPKARLLHERASLRPRKAVPIRPNSPCISRSRASKSESPGVTNHVRAEYHTQRHGLQRRKRVFGDDRSPEPNAKSQAHSLGNCVESCKQAAEGGSPA